MRQTTLLDDLGIKLGIGCYHERIAKDRMHSPSRRHEEIHNRKSMDLPPHLESP